MIFLVVTQPSNNLPLCEREIVFLAAAPLVFDVVAHPGNKVIMVTVQLLS